MIAMSSSRGDPCRAADNRERGFTLVELLTVLAIMALLAAIAATRLSRGAGAQSASQNGGRILALLEGAHSRALGTGKTVLIRPADLPAGFAIAGDAGLAFHADGSASGGIVKGPRGREIIVDWISGHAHARD